jgi:hypothetical protein
MTANAIVECRSVKLEINYRQKNITEYDSNVDAFETLMSLIKVLTPFVSFQTVQPPEREDVKAQATTAILEFYFGTRTY